MGSTRGKTKQQQKRLNCFNRLEERKQNKTNRKKNEIGKNSLKDR